MERHIERLFESARAIRLQIPATRDEVEALVVETCRRNRIVDGYIRLLVTRGAGDLGLDPRGCPRPDLVVIARAGVTLYKRKPTEGITAVTSAFRRNAADATSPGIKSLNYLNNVLARIEASDHGADEAILLDRDGHVAEATADNVFIVTERALVTPPTSTNLRGITRETILRLAEELGIRADEKPFALFDLWSAREAFMCVSTKMADLLRDAFKRRALRGEPRVLVIEMGDKVVPGMGGDIREFVEDALRQSRVEVHTLTRVVKVNEKTLVFEHNGTQTEIDTAAVVWAGGVRMNPLIENLPVEKTSRGLIVIKPTLQLHSHGNVFALGDIAFFKDAAPTLAGTAQLALQQAALAARNIKALLSGDELQTKQFEELGEAVSLGTERAAVLAGGKAFGGPLARQARFALYTARLPTWHHRLRVGASWFFDGTTPRPLLPLGLRR